MNDGFKQRLVGAVVLVSLVLILWPVVFSEGINPVLDQTSQIPATPHFEKHVVAKPTRPDNIPAIVQPVIEDIKPQVVKVPIEEKTKSTNKETPTDTPRLDKQRLPVSWALQVASFAQRNNAIELKQRLLKQGYKAFTQTIATGSGSSTRVLIGPRLRKTAFDKDKPIIEKSFNVKSMVVRFQQ